MPTVFLRTFINCTVSYTLLWICTSGRSTESPWDAVYLSPQVCNTVAGKWTSNILRWSYLIDCTHLCASAAHIVLAPIISLCESLYVVLSFPCNPQSNQATSCTDNVSWHMIRQKGLRPSCSRYLVHMQSPAGLMLSLSSHNYTLQICSVVGLLKFCADNTSLFHNIQSIKDQ